MLYISSTFTKDQTPFKETFKLCEQNKISNIEIGSNHCYEENLDYIIKKKNYNFLVHNYFPIPEKDFVVNIASSNQSIRERSIDHIFNSLKFCNLIDAKLYTFHPGFLTDPDGSKQFRDNYDFNWNNSLLSKTNYSESFDLMIESLKKIIKFAKDLKINVSIESEGSFHKNQHLLMQQPEEFTKLFGIFDNKEFGINLNIGHLNLASRAFNFDKLEFVNVIKDNIVAFELSHNDGNEDEHKPLIDNQWYWDVINDNFFDKCFKILEFRNQNISTIIKTINLFNFKKNQHDFNMKK